MHPFLCSISFFFIFLLFIFNLPLSTSQSEVEVDFRFSTCSQHFDCGTFKNISYPFWGRSRPDYCGHPNFKLECLENDDPVITITDRKYRVLAINETNQTLHIARTDSWNGDCPVGPMFNTTIDTRLFTYPTPVTQNLTVAFGCSLVGREVGGKDFICNISGSPMVGFSSWSDPASLYPKLLGCWTAITIPVFTTAASPNPTVEDVLKQGFQVQYDVDAEECKECEKSDGQCGFNRNTGGLQCFCRRGPNKRTCSRGKNHVGPMIAIGVSTGVGVILLAFVFYFIFRRRRKLLSKSSALISRDITPDSSSKPDLEKDGSSYFQTPIFTYDELEEATNKFDSSKELGDGGFGTVYHGKLKDGRVVAVKRLYENNYKRVEQFMNEIAILSRLRHKNLVSLYGCTSRHSRELLLVYEFVPNGTVADHLHGDRAKSSLLTWSIRMGIAIESADALSYLHASDTIHRDVKTNNILLDNNFHVKVADFGLSRLFPNDVTHVSTAPQGTPGYVDPEYYQCYQLNDKSDVYSFGVVLIELISAKPAVDITRHRHEINLSNMAINKIHNDALHELVDPSLRFESNYTTKRMITMVAELAFRCLQQEKDMRPSMNEVLEALKEIENEQCKAEKADEVELPADARLLKNIQPLSPNSVTDKWVSSYTTPNTSA